MNYLMIQNMNEIPLNGIRLLGYSEKRKDGAIGRFGTGLKEAICLLHRLNSEIIIYSGDTEIKFTTVNDEIGYILSKDMDGKVKDTFHPLNLHVKFGHHDWKDPWQALREVFCNALDEDFIHYSVVGSDELYGKKGATRTFIRLTPDIYKAYNEISEKILILDPSYKPIHTIDNDKIYPKRGNEFVQIYNRGIWVQQGVKKSLYNYDLSLLRLHESRNADWADVHRLVTNLIPYMPAEMVAEILQLWVKASEDEDFNYIEASTIHCSTLAYAVQRPTIGKMFRDAFDIAFGTDAVASPRSIFYVHSIEKLGYKAIVFANDHLNVLEKAGCRTYKTKLDDAAAAGVEVIDGCEVKYFDAVWNVVGSGVKPKVRVYNDIGGKMGNAGFQTKEAIYVPERVIGSQQEIMVLINVCSKFVHRDASSYNQMISAYDHILKCLADRIYEDADIEA